ncbi:MAG: SEL1-like repeat protein, partial [Oscillospiraceae bacterium]|nr:SEL1-like repeat protein [Oscillospiraceae bacterium]
PKLFFIIFFYDFIFHHVFIISHLLYFRKRSIDILYRIENFLDNTIIKCDTFSDTSFDTAFQCLFTYTEAGMYKEAEEYVKRLENMQYPNMELVKKYLYCMKKQIFVFVEKFVPMKSLEYLNSWEEGKMLVAIDNPDSWYSNNLFHLRNWMNRLENHITTGKEMYAMALLTTNQQKASLEWLINSFSAGYAPAGAILLEIAEKSGNVDFKFLAGALYPEACIVLGDKEIELSNEPNWIDSETMLYYKLAASTENAPAVAKIVYIIYQQHFSSVPIIECKKEKERMEQNAKILILLCAWLKENRYQSMHFMEIMGVLQFCTKQFSQSIRTLSGINTPASNYCKGRMYEDGKGVSMDYEQALSHYKKSLGFKDASKRYQIVRNIQRKQEEEQQKGEVYSRDYDYSERTSYSKTPSYYKRDSCFITTAAACSLRKGDDCEELNLLRKFRDEYICRSEEGQELVLEYYRIAPLILEKINQQPNPEMIYNLLWQTYILPSISCLKAGNFSEAQDIYITMVRKLADRFEVSVSNYIKQHYYFISN